MRSFSFVAIVIVIFATFLPICAYAMPEDSDFIKLETMVMSFDEADASVTVTYDLGPFARIYVLAFGTRHLESSFNEIFSEYDNAEIKEVGYDTVKIELKDISRSSDTYYLHDSRDLNNIVSSIKVIYPNGQTKTVNNVKETPNIFYQQL